MIVLGRIVAPFGVHGWLKIQPFGDDPLLWREISCWWVGRDPESTNPEDWRQFKLAGVRGHGRGIVAAFEGIGDRTAAESIHGCYVAAPREALPQPAKDEYYWADLVGLRVVGNDGVALGVVRGLIETGAHDVLDVVDGDMERLIPFVGAYIKAVDIPGKEILVDWGPDW